MSSRILAAARAGSIKLPPISGREATIIPANLPSSVNTAPPVLPRGAGMLVLTYTVGRNLPPNSMFCPVAIPMRGEAAKPISWEIETSTVAGFTGSAAESIKTTGRSADLKLPAIFITDTVVMGSNPTFSASRRRPLYSIQSFCAPLVMNALVITAPVLLAMNPEPTSSIVVFASLPAESFE